MYFWRYVLFMVPIVACLVIPIGYGREPKDFYDLGGVLIMVIGLVCLSYGTFGPRDLSKGISVAFGKIETASPDEVHLAGTVVAAAMRYAVGLGLLAFLLNAIGRVTREPSDDFFYRNSHPASTEVLRAGHPLVSLLYSVLFLEVLLAPLHFRILRHRGPGASPPPTALTMLLLVLGATFALKGLS